ncbi:glycerol-3-phosphate 2-O-acyltransferase 6-like [Trifolium medium]|uniref:Glycerol-3-phosphate 2-O-acyltransferase 6-like n=1 Tax=Trifolium medium TaxID=97028 RepID=A0A392QD97_9FABA|nr:glycerol-3-phosphate 2-O-acyltransferase 6-like [Trifolium medium]
MVEPFLKEFLGADMVLGTEIASYKGRATGLICNPGILVGDKKAQVLKKTFGDEKPDIGLGDRVTDAPFMALCKKSDSKPVCYQISIQVISTPI